MHPVVDGGHLRLLLHPGRDLHAGIRRYGRDCQRRRSADDPGVRVHNLWDLRSADDLHRSPAGIDVAVHGDAAVQFLRQRGQRRNRRSVSNQFKSYGPRHLDHVRSHRRSVRNQPERTAAGQSL
uniref:(northern house mosquito) hypothetical protein n=1 Tax=Culex pipiens TaxID=7175 RepID=A0A8D8FQH8_CULPI